MNLRFKLLIFAIILCFANADLWTFQSFIKASDDIEVTYERECIKLFLNGFEANDILELEFFGEGDLQFYGKKGFEVFSFSEKSCSRVLKLSKSSIGFLPEKIVIPIKGFYLYSAFVNKNSFDKSIPVADIGQIIFSKLENDRVFNVYRWNLEPSVIIFDTRDYKTQSRFFKRLAFFIEKSGYTGKLCSNRELAKDRGWKAHDYRAEDLALFFNLAKEQNFRLNEEEIILQNILVDAGVIKKSFCNFSNCSHFHFTSGEGAVLSVSREAFDNYRYRLLTHECLHGLFFTNKSFRRGIIEQYNNLSENEKRIWKLILADKDYDSSNPVLMANEAMAYNLQQPEVEIKGYFNAYLIDKLCKDYPEEKSFIESFMKENQDFFIENARVLNKILFQTTGYDAYELVSFKPAKLEDWWFRFF